MRDYLFIASIPIPQIREMQRAAIIQAARTRFEAQCLRLHSDMTWCHLSPEAKGGHCRDMQAALERAASEHLFCTNLAYEKKLDEMGIPSLANARLWREAFESNDDE